MAVFFANSLYKKTKKKEELPVSSSNKNPYSNTGVFYSNATKKEGMVNKPRTDVSSTQNPTLGANEYLNDKDTTAQPTPTVNPTAMEKFTQTARDLYTQKAPLIQEEFDSANRSLEKSKQEYGELIRQAQERGKQQDQLIKQEYAQKEQQAKTATEQDLRRAAEARREVQAGIDRKFANLGTLGSTGYFGQSGETQRAESDFIRRQQQTMDSGRQDLENIGINRNQRLLDARTEVQNEISGFKATIDKINSTLSTNDVERRKALLEAYTDLEDRIYKIEDNFNTGGAKDINSEIKIANDYDSALKNINYFDVSNSYNRAKSANINTSEGQFNIIYSFVKLLDPATGVKEGEFQNTVNAQSLKNKAIGLLNNWGSGTTVAPETAQAFLNEMERIAQPTLQRAKQINDTYKNYYANYNLNPALIGNVDTGTTNTAQKNIYQVGSYQVEEL